MIAVFRIPARLADEGDAYQCGTWPCSDARTRPVTSHTLLRTSGPDPRKSFEADGEDRRGSVYRKGSRGQEKERTGKEAE
jgi:hypothetical protein